MPPPPTPLDVFKHVQDTVVHNLLYSCLRMPSFADCVVKLDEMQ